MDNLYNKIYEAVNTGIQKALIINPDNDVSVKWVEKHKSTNIDMMQYYIDSMISTNNAEIYYDILKCAKQQKLKYKVKNFDELLEIYNIVKDEINNFKTDMLSWIDTTNAISFILESDKEFSWDNFKKIYKILFIKIKSSECDHDIILNVNHIEPDEFFPCWKRSETDRCWKPDNIKFNNKNCISNEAAARNDYAGYENTYKNININYNSYNNEAIRYCTDLSLEYCYEGYDAYLPAIGELLYLSKCENIINFFLEYIGIEAKLQIYDDYEVMYWSSTESSEKYAWCIGKNSHDLFDFDEDTDKINIETADKNDTNAIIPLFIKNN